MNAAITEDFAGFFERRAVERLDNAPRQAEAGAFGDHAINGMIIDPDRIAALIPAAVLIAINRATGGVVLTRRAAHLSKHPGQIAFPGGRIDSGDAGPLAAALREAEEEIGLPGHLVEPIGYLDEYMTGTGFRITPVVAMIGSFESRIDAGEVDALFETPLAFLMEPGNHQILTRTFNGVPRQAYAMPYEEHMIWGVTAGIIRRLYERVMV
jgi:8-oxo-dGTP pyrophosphatase MutT (NUDIX family)